MSEEYDLLVEHLTDDFGVDPALVRPQATLTDLELDSLAAVELSLALLDKWGVEPQELTVHATVAEVAGLLELVTTNPVRIPGNA